MKVRVKKELPFAKVGEEMPVNDEGKIFVRYGKNAHPVCKIWVDRMIEDGWLEEVREEESLKEKFHNHNLAHGAYHYDLHPDELADIARKHERERYMRKFDEAIKSFENPFCRKGELVGNEACKYIRQALFGEEE